MITQLVHVWANIGLYNDISRVVPESSLWSLPDQVYHDDVIKWKHFPRYWPFVRGIHRSPWRGDLRRHRAHYDVTVMSYNISLVIWMVALSYGCIKSVTPVSYRTDSGRMLKNESNQTWFTSLLEILWKTTYTCGLLLCNDNHHTQQRNFPLFVCYHCIVPTRKEPQEPVWGRNWPPVRANREEPLSHCFCAICRVQAKHHTYVIYPMHNWAPCSFQLR